MSDNWLRFISTDPAWVPYPSQRDAAVALLEGWLPDAEEVVATQTDDIQFIDAGVNLETIRCPACGSEVPFDWWTERVNESSTIAFRDLAVTTPCCAAVASLNDLDFDWPVGFARFVIDAMNPDVEDLQAAQLEQLAQVLGTPVRRIWQHL